MWVLPAVIYITLALGAKEDVRWLGEGTWSGAAPLGGHPPEDDSEKLARKITEDLATHPAAE